MDKKLNIFFADLRHNYQGILSSDTMPIGIGFMKAVLDYQIPSVDSKLFCYPDKLENELKTLVPDVIFFTNYMWNENLSLSFAKYIKNNNPDTLVVIGGPNIYLEKNKRIEFFKKNDFIDIYALGEGDFYCAEIVQLFIKNNCNISNLLQEDIHSSIYKFQCKEVICTDIKPRSKNLDDIPSPWLKGIMDEFFDGKLVPLIETNRGCPFTCTFCVQGTKWYTKVNYFSLDRIKEEIYYIAKKNAEKSPQQKALIIADPNFGMFERDIEISSYLGETQKDYKWPLFIDATTGKNKADIIIKSIEKVNGALAMYLAVQSLSEPVLENIKRKNIKISTYKEVQVYIQGRGLKSSSDLILCLPGETFQSHINSLKKIINSGTNRLNNFQSLLLKGSELETSDEREKYAFKTRYRLIPKNIGKYLNSKIFDIEEIVVETKDFTFQEYIISRIFHFLISLYWNDSRFSYLITFLNKMGFENWEFVEALFEYSKIRKPPLLKEFLEETENELFKSPDDLIKFYSMEENFTRAVNSEIGDNLIYKYKSISSLWLWEDTCNFAFNAVWHLLEKNNKTVVEYESFRELFGEWEIFTRYSYSFGKNPDELIEDKKEHFKYDIDQWNEKFEYDKIDSYLFDNPQLVRFSPTLINKQNLIDSVKVWGYSLKSMSMFVRRTHSDWRIREIKKASQSLVF